ncbi:MAG: hypothetical protein COV72_02980 [Candidatus Omnitrophica bacterium CG11_big_fil_rev_8_21_14_0_20_42_13]|uniref:ABC transporter domain-containing protein n=1 Tax=Candidatus Ghiorseimicrobium undicola TaxID=1974746 RepID=A0A2H0LYM6_9BACT|nr:MAG: hypothetical protein COV72_02980 [Candidatus Omnitrophica bacterium CG11_big_fil_rev_8_21_14_0_20_42_13]
MSNVIEFNNVWKKFNRGEKLNSIRDLVPAMFGKALPLGNGGALKKEEFWALQDVDFKVEKGEVLGIIGPNGAGKSTTLKLLSGIMPPNKGEIKINGKLSALIEVTAGFHPELTGRENIYLNGTILGMRKKEIDAKFNDIVEFSELGEFIDTPVKRYSSGMYSRLGFSVAAHMEPDILLVDEVLSVGDIAFQAKCANKMRELLNSNTTIILVSHNLALVQSLCKRVILIENGKIFKEGGADEVITHYQNIVYKKEGEKLQKKIRAAEDKPKINQNTLIDISNVLISNGDLKHKNSFKGDEPISVTIEYNAKKLIEKPVFNLTIVRSDGIICCSASTSDNGALKTSEIEGNGKIKIDFGKLNLTAGTYIIRIYIWDKDMMYAYIKRNQDIFRIELENFNRQTKAVFLPKVKWEIE